jgi:hypothetical protein
MGVERGFEINMRKRVGNSFKFWPGFGGSLSRGKQQVGQQGLKPGIISVLWPD